MVLLSQPSSGSLHVANDGTTQKAPVTIATPGNDREDLGCPWVVTTGGSCLTRAKPSIQKRGTELQAGDSHPAQNRHPSENPASAQTPPSPPFSPLWGYSQSLQRQCLSHRYPASMASSTSAKLSVLQTDPITAIPPLPLPPPFFPMFATSSK